MAEAPRTSDRRSNAVSGDPLLATKLYIPAVRSGLVPRPGLLARLTHQGLTSRLILISAPPGSGKTTLVSEWAHALGELTPPRTAIARSGHVPEADEAVRVAWISLDSGDNDVVRFLQYVVTALQETVPGVGRATQELLRSVPMPTDHSILTVLANEVSATPCQVVLVLDDYHFIEAAEVHQAIAFLLAHMPSQMCLVIVTRTDPPLPLARLRARNQLTEIRADDLRFSLKEASSFMEHTMSVELTPDQVAALQARSEGWIAGLQLAALSLHRHEASDRGDLISAFAGTQRAVADYLTEEVLQYQPQSIQSFLLCTAILDRLCGPLCDALMEVAPDKSPVDPSRDPLDLRLGTIGKSQATLEHLERSNLFLIPLDEERRWYRYHHLFSDSLRQRLGQTHPYLVPQLHRQAARWFEQSELVEEALAHWVESGDVEAAASLVEEQGQILLSRGEMATVKHWVDQLPPMLVRQRPWLCVLSAWALVLAWDIANAKTLLQLAQEQRAPGCSADRDRELKGHITAIHAYVAVLEHEDQRGLELCRQALNLLPEHSVFLRGLITYFLAAGCLRAGDLAGAMAGCEEALRTGMAGDNVFVSAASMSLLGTVYEFQGRLDLAYETYLKALKLATAEGGHQLAVASAANSSIGALLYEWNDLDGADPYLLTSIEQSSQWGNQEGIRNASMVRARVLQAQGDLAGAWGVIHEAERAVATTSLPGGQLGSALVRYWLDRGDLDAATQVAQDRGIDARQDVSFANMSEWTTLVRLRIAQGRLAEATNSLSRLRAFCEAAAAAAPLMEVLRLQALALHAQNRTAQALIPLERALALAEPGGYVRSFVDEGPAMASLLNELGAAMRDRDPKTASPRTERLVAYVERLLVALGRAEVASGIPPRSMGNRLIEPLTERELEVLRLVAAGKTNQQIADELILATGTVKKHLSNIFGKLGVQSRTQCIVRAQEAHLI